MEFNILVLGDCIGNGQNVLVHTILEQDDCVQQDFSMISDKKQEKFLIKWYLKNRDKKIPVHKDTMVSEALKFKREQEKLFSWPKFLNTANLFNLCVDGESFMGMTIKLNKFILENGKPDLVLITDIARTHYCYYTNYNGEKKAIKRDILFVDQEQNLYPKEAYKKFQNNVEKQVRQGEHFWIRKNNKLIKVLENNLQYNNLRYEFVFFRSISKRYEVSKKPINAYHFMPTYTNPDQTISTKKKLETQKNIAEYVSTFLKD